MSDGARRSRSGLFISFEGVEGSGKSTQMRLLVERLRTLDPAVVESQEPGGTAIGREIRRLLLDPANHEMAPMTELLLMFASRAQAAAETIIPALKSGAVVVSDRFTDSSLAYQGEARGLGFEKVLAMHRLALGSLFPDITICLDLDVEVGLLRAHQRNQGSAELQSEGRIDQQSRGFHEIVREAYRRLASLEPERVHLIDAEGNTAEVAQRVWTVIAPLIQPSLRAAR